MDSTIREARLRAEYAHLYPPVQPGVWTPAAEVGARMLFWHLQLTGTVVLGCVGKGVSHDYEYFAYRGELDLDHYRLPDGSTVPQPQLRDHMLQFGQLVFSYGTGEFADALFERRNRWKAEVYPRLPLFGEQVAHKVIA